MHCWGFRHFLNCVYYRAVLYLTVLETNKNCANSRCLGKWGHRTWILFPAVLWWTETLLYSAWVFFFSPEIVFAKYLQYFLFAVSIQQSSQDYLENGHRVFQQGDNLKRLVCTKGYEMSTFIQIKLLPKTKFYTLFPNWIQSFSLNMVGSVVCCKDSERGTNARFYTLSFPVLFRNCSRESKESWINFRPSVDFKKISS